MLDAVSGLTSVVSSLGWVEATAAIFVWYLARGADALSDCYSVIPKKKVEICAVAADMQLLCKSGTVGADGTVGFTFLDALDCWSSFRCCVLTNDNDMILCVRPYYSRLIHRHYPRSLPYQSPIARSSKC